MNACEPWGHRCGEWRGEEGYRSRGGALFHGFMKPMGDYQQWTRLLLRQVFKILDIFLNFVWHNNEWSKRIKAQTLNAPARCIPALCQCPICSAAHAYRGSAATRVLLPPRFRYAHPTGKGEFATLDTITDKLRHDNRRTHPVKQKKTKASAFKTRSATSNW